MSLYRNWAQQTRLYPFLMSATTFGSLFCSSTPHLEKITSEICQWDVRQLLSGHSKTGMEYLLNSRLPNTFFSWLLLSSDEAVGSETFPERDFRHP